MSWKFSPSAASKSCVTSHWFLIKKGKLLLFCTSDSISCSACLLTFLEAVCELEWNRTRCPDNHTRGVPSLGNRPPQPITDLHAVEDAGRKIAHRLAVLLLYIQYTSEKIKCHYKVHIRTIQMSSAHSYRASHRA